MPTVWQALENKGTRFLRGQLCLVCAGPGTGKSAFVLSYALQAGIPTMYFSADSDAFTQISRAVSIMTGWAMERSTLAVRNENLGDATELFECLPIRFYYSASPTLDNIQDCMQAYLQVYGTYPSLVVVDNVTNVQTDLGDDDPFSGLEGLMDYLHDMARKTSACVIGLHHVTGEYNNGDKTPPLSGVKGQIGRVPEMVLTLARRKSESGFAGDPDTLFVGTVKNRGGKSDPSGQDAAELEFFGDSMTIRDIGLAHT